MALCGKCNEKVDRDNDRKIQCGDCKKIFHGACVSLQLSDITYITKEKQYWRCSTCVNIRKSNTNIACSSPVLSKPTVLMKNVTTADYDFDIINEIKLLRQQFNDKLDQLSADFKSLDFNLSKKITALLNENQILKCENEKLTVRLNNLEQANVNNCVDIVGIPTTDGEDIASVVTNVFTKCLNIKFNTYDMEDAYRIKQSNNIDLIRIKLSSVATKKAIFLALKKKKDLCLKDLGLAGENKIYINQCLTSASRALYKAAIAAKKSERCKYVWIKNGNILVRKHVGGKVMKITCVNDLDFLK